ncbi:MAG: helix-turn-helix domain-containing protein [Streptococcaceae bacterium]|nr:helix-turn-helix domain-containing protein [Streptococcaceae bacterium]
MVQKAIGQVLSERRSQTGWSLDKAEKQTAIKKIYISALETDNYATFPGEFYARAYLKQYATRLDLDTEAILEAYDNETPVEIDDEFFEDTGNYRFIRPDQRVAARPVTLEEMAAQEEVKKDTRRHYLPIILLSAVAVLIIAAVTAIVVLNFPKTTTPQAAAYSSSTSSSSSATSSSSALTTSASTALTVTSKGAQLTATLSAAKNPVSLKITLKTGVSSAAIQLTNSNVPQVQLTAVNPVFSGALNSQVTSATLTFSDASQLAITLDGQTLTLPASQSPTKFTSLVLNIAYPINPSTSATTRLSTESSSQ